MKYLFFILLSFLMMKGYSNTIVVGSGSSITSIRKGLETAHNGDTILIKKGVYKEGNIIITKSLTILGENFPEINGEDKYEIFTVSGQNITIKGLFFNSSGYSSMNDYAALGVIDARNITIENNRFAKTYFSIHFANCTNFTVRGNVMHGLTKTEQTTGNGIHLWKCSHALIENNNIQGHRDGLYFEFVTESLIRNNLSTLNIRYGIHFMFSNNDTYTNNTFSNNGAGVAVMFSHHVTMTNNRFEKNWGGGAYGLLLKEINDAKILHNTFYQNTVGIQMEGTNRIEVWNNTFQANGWAAKVQASCSDNNFHHNNFFGNTFDVSTNGSLVLNQFTSNYWDKYEGYDINKDGIGDVPFHPVSMYSMIVEENPNSLMLLRSFIVSLLDKAEKAIPSLTPENLRDDKPIMKPLKL